MEIIELKELPEATIPAGLDTLGVDKNNQGYRIPAGRLNRIPTGTGTSAGTYSTTAAGLNVNPLSGNGRTFACLFTTPAEVPSAGIYQTIFSRYTYYNTNSHELCITINSSGVMKVTAGDRKTTGGSADFQYPFFPDQLHLVVLRIGTNGNVNLMINGSEWTDNKGSDTITIGTPMNELCIGNKEPVPAEENHQHFTGKIHWYAEYDGLLTDTECTALWNDGRPDPGFLPAEPETAQLVARYLPADLSADGWADSSGNGYDLTATDTTALDYAPIPDAREITLDTGVFYTDIATGISSKQIHVPKGYAPMHVAVFNYSNSTSLSGVKVTAVGSAFIANGFIPHTPQHTIFLYSTGAHLSNSGSINTTGSVWGDSSYYLNVNATGNTTTGGMRVRVICRYVGF